MTTYSQHLAAQRATLQPEALCQMAAVVVTSCAWGESAMRLTPDWRLVYPVDPRIGETARYLPEA